MSVRKPQIDLRHSFKPAAPASSFAPLATERLALRPYRPEDAAELHRLINDWEVTRNLAAVPFPYPRDAGGRVDPLGRRLDGGRHAPIIW